MSTDLINRLKNGDQEAFREIVENYKDMIFKTCISIINNYDDANDLVQEVFIEAYKSISKFRGDAKISTWLYRIAINKSINFKRTLKHQKLFQSLSLSSKSESKTTSNVNENPYTNLKELQKREIMNKAIDSLPKNQKKAFILNKIDDLSYKEISEIMNISVSSVESLLFRAKKNLQKKLIHCYRKC